MTHPKILFASFDKVPAPKGASTHILAFAKRLGLEFGNVVLVTPGQSDQEVTSIATGLRQVELGTPDDNPVGRIRTFREKLAALLRRQSFQVIHFRSPFEGLPICEPSLNRGAKLIYEVNGFPSIEMPYHYSRLQTQTAFMQKLIQFELHCLESADRILTVSDVNRDYIQSRLSTDKPIQVIRNGVDLSMFPFRPPCPFNQDDDVRIAYVGTVSRWQGVHVLVEATELVNKIRPCSLNIVGLANPKRNRELFRLIDRLRLQKQVVFSPAENQREVCARLQQAHVTVAPLLKTRRNTIQGCCPIKVIEAMASGCPLIASDLPVVRELAEPETHFAPARAGDARNLKNVILELAENQELAGKRATAARTQVEQNWTWQNSTDQLIHAYRSIIG